MKQTRDSVFSGISFFTNLMIGTKKEGYAATAYPIFRWARIPKKTQPATRNFHKKKKGIYHRHPIFINLKSNTMKNTVQK